MQWEDSVAEEEFRWLTFMAAYKYDGYRDYHVGARFIASLAKWLQQFSEIDRHAAYSFVKTNLIYFSPSEIQRLIEKLFPEYAQEDIILSVSGKLGIEPYKVWSNEKYIKVYENERRKTLYMGLSDGARIDVLRRVNVGRISNEQVIIATQVDVHKWKSLLDDLRKERGMSSNEKFSRVYLIDDFTASGTSFLPNNAIQNEKGKLVKFLKSVKDVSTSLGTSPFSDDLDIFVHHYIGTEKAIENITSNYSSIEKEFRSTFKFKSITFRYGMCLSKNISLNKNCTLPFVKLCQNYYDNVIEGKHGSQSGEISKMFGYGGCGLPVVLEHNTPNNSIPLLWAETNSDNNNHKMIPLFRRRERHSDIDPNSQVGENK